MASALMAWSALCSVACAASIPDRPPRSEIEAVMVSAASSLTDVLGETARMYEQTGRDRIVLNFAGSNTLARQILAGAPVDLFVSANPAEMDRVERAGRIEPGSRIALLSNQLVVVVPDDLPHVPGSAGELGDTAVRRIAMGDPRAVPAGVYARQYLQSRHAWSSLRSKVVPMRSVRAALAAVEAGNADAAFVYRTDAMTARRASLAFAIPVDEGPAIVYPAAVMATAHHAAGARRFLAYLTGAAARAAFERAGFISAVPGCDRPEQQARAMREGATPAPPWLPSGAGRIFSPAS